MTALIKSAILSRTSSQALWSFVKSSLKSKSTLWYRSSVTFKNISKDHRRQDTAVSFLSRWEKRLSRKLEILLSCLGASSIFCKFQNNLKGFKPNLKFSCTSDFCLEHFGRDLQTRRLLLSRMRCFKRPCCRKFTLFESEHWSWKYHHCRRRCSWRNSDARRTSPRSPRIRPWSSYHEVTCCNWLHSSGKCGASCLRQSSLRLGAAIRIRGFAAVFLYPTGAALQSDELYHLVHDADNVFELVYSGIVESSSHKTQFQVRILNCSSNE